MRTCELKETANLFPAHLGTILTPFWRVAAAARVARKAGRPSGLSGLPEAAAQKLVWIVAYRRTFYDHDREQDVSRPAAVSEVFVRRRDPKDPAEDIHPVWTIHMRGEVDVQELKRTYGRRFALPLTIAAFQASAFDDRNEVVFEYEFGSDDRRAGLSRGCLRALSQTSSTAGLSLRRDTSTPPRRGTLEP